MASITESVRELQQKVAALTARIAGLYDHSPIYAIFGKVVMYGCKVTQGASSPLDMTIRLQGQAAGDSTWLNPHASATPTYPYEFTNQALGPLKGIYQEDTTAEVAAAPGTGLGRYDIAYVYVSKSGPGFAIQTGTPSSAVKSDFDSNGLATEDYNAASPNFDPALPVGAVPVGRIYVGPNVTQITDSVIADIRVSPSL